MSIQLRGSPDGAKKVPKTTKTVSWNDAVDSFMAALEHDGCSQHTTHHYRDDLRAFAAWWKRMTPKEVLAPQALTDYDLREWQRYLREEKLDEIGRTRKPATINAKMAALQSFLKWARRTRVIRSMLDMPPPADLGERVVKWLDMKQQRQLLRAVARDRNPRNRELVVILIEMGLRVAELVELCWHDIKLGERKGSLTVRKGKGCKPRGPLPFTPEALRAFQKLRALDPADDDGNRIFTSQRKDPAGGRNKPLTVRGVQELLNRYAAKLGWERLHPHQLRHTFAKNKRAQKPPADWPVIAKLMGHSSSKTTMDNYAVPGDADLEAAQNPHANDDGDDDE